MRDFNRDRKFGRSGQRRRGSGGQGFGGSGRFSRDSDNSEKREFRKPSFEREMHSVTCDKCGQRCEVPFRPSGGKPVYCNNCFRKDETSESKPSDQYKQEFQKINEKLDMILKAIE